MEEQHIASAFDRDLQQIESELMKMGGLVELAINQSVEALRHSDVKLAQAVRSRDKEIDDLEMHEAKGKSIAFAFGRFNPPTIGHEKLINKVAS
ncbi:MAG: PhoU domain-containing protein, partial [Planktomarina sp.]